MEGFRKILKKFEKVTKVIESPRTNVSHANLSQANAQGVYMSEKVCPVIISASRAGT
jgi:hypothetical protein